MGRRLTIALITAVIAGAVAAPAGAADLTGVAGVEASDVTKRDVKRALTKAVASGARPQELRAPSPAWFDRKQQRKTKRDRDGVRTAPVDAPLPSGIGIRPGTWMISPHWCTMNFIFQKGRTLAMGTAGHCLTDTKDSLTADVLGEQVTLLTIAPTTSDPVLVRLGRVLLKRDGGIGRDYGLVEIPRALHQWVFPTVATIGGPCGVYTDMTPMPVAHYGHGLGVGTGGTPRAGMGLSFQPPKGFRWLETTWDRDSIFWAGLINGGDSGSPVRVAQLPAVSNLTHGLGLPLVPTALAWGTRVSTITSSGWQLVNSMLCPPA